ncbi:hypothetical protein BHE97_05960 [Aeromicrobium sp. PE09-221]|uniref:hypothetical protein n=1 Tax=Aeromicrobium sp. PE09-221 TaxID=1898043 RepID=UPI000B3E730F|nr:hypothetical protein [Aeromicrobium sp. PE09-221]OUZ10978.1 hypothetical protein BHE97_05960 [Aeromicrobium sp. PE09-221]
MTEPSGRGVWARGRTWLITVIVVVGLVLVGIGVRLGPQLLDRHEAAAIANRAAEAAEALPGVTSAEATVDQRFRSHRRVLRERLSGTASPRGEVTIDIVLASDLGPEQLAEVLISTRQELADPALARHAVSVNYTQLGSERRIFDGWGVVQPLVTRSDDELSRIAGYALDLPEGAWFDLDPSTFEQGQFMDAGPPLYDQILGRDIHESFTVGARLESPAAEFLGESARLTGIAADVLDGPTALYLKGSNDTTVLTTTELPGLNEALRQIAARAGQGDADELDVSFGAERVWTIGGDIDGTVRVTLTLGAAGTCANDDLYASFISDAARILDEQSIEHSIDMLGCP